MKCLQLETGRFRVTGYLSGKEEVRTLSRSHIYRPCRIWGLCSIPGSVFSMHISLQVLVIGLALTVTPFHPIPTSRFNVFKEERDKMYYSCNVLCSYRYNVLWNYNCSVLCKYRGILCDTMRYNDKQVKLPTTVT